MEFQLQGQVGEDGGAGHVVSRGEGPTVLTRAAPGTMGMVSLGRGLHCFARLPGDPVDVPVFLK